MGMNFDSPVIGMRGWGTYIPETFISAAEISEKSGIPENVIIEKIGCRQKPLAGKGDTPAFMAAEAAEKAILMADIDPSEIDCVIYNGGQHKDYICWLAGLKIADSIGAINAWSFDMEAMCGSMISGFEVARGLIMSGRCKTILLASGYRNGDLVSYSVPETTFMFDLGAGGSSVILQAGYDKNILLGASFRGDGSFSELCTVKPGGVKNWPLAEGELDKIHFTIDDPQLFKDKLKEVTIPNFYKVVREALAESGLGDENLDYLGILHFNRRTHDMFLKEFNLKPEQSFYLEDYGHIGQNDQIISLEEGLKLGRIKDGDNVVFVAGGIGFVWSACVIRMG
jgi:3-oxoacyl-[acyl-carrier-protein] synthase-3